MTPAIPWIVIGMIFYIIGEYYAKKYANISLRYFGAISLFGYSIGTVCWLGALSKYNSLSILGTMWNVLYIIITLVMGIVIFKESITTIQIVGLFFAFIAIILLSI